MKIYKKCLCPIVILIITIVLAIPATIYANQNATNYK